MVLNAKICRMSTKLAIIKQRTLIWGLIVLKYEAPLLDYIKLLQSLLTVKFLWEVFLLVLTFAVFMSWLEIFLTSLHFDLKTDLRGNVKCCAKIGFGNKRSGIAFASQRSLRFLETIFLGWLFFFPSGVCRSSFLRGVSCLRQWFLSLAVDDLESLRKFRSARGRPQETSGTLESFEEVS